jgi:hypothetical protein
MECRTVVKGASLFDEQCRDHFRECGEFTVLGNAREGA